MNDIEIGKRIRILRKKRALSQQELADKVGVTWEMISRYERGKSSALNKVQDLAVALEVSLSALIGNEPSIVKDSKIIDESFVPLLTSIPSSRTDLIAYLQEQMNGVKVYGVSNESRTFALELGEQSKVRINIRSIFPNGLLICSLDVDHLEEKNIIVAANNGLVSIEEYSENSNQIPMAKVLQWIVRLSK